MTLVISQTGSVISGELNQVVAPTGGTSPVGLILMSNAAITVPPIMRYGGLVADGRKVATDSLSVAMAIAYWLDITGRDGDLMESLDTHGGQTYHGWVFIEGGELAMLNHEAAAESGSFTSPSETPTAGGNIVSVVSGCKYNQSYAAGVNATEFYSGNASDRRCAGYYGVSTGDEDWSIEMTGAGATGGWQAHGYCALEEVGPGGGGGKRMAQSLILA
jgi:hypothetical protein